MAVHQAPTAPPAGRATCTSSSIRRCAPPRSSSTPPAPSRARGRSSPTCCPRTPPRSCARRSPVEARRCSAVRARAREPDRRAHRLQPGPRAAVRDRQGIAVQRPGPRRSPCPRVDAARPGRARRLRSSTRPESCLAGLARCIVSGHRRRARQRAGVPLSGATLEIGGDLPRGVGDCRPPRRSRSRSASRSPSSARSGRVDRRRRQEPRGWSGSSSPGSARAWRTTGSGAQTGLLDQLACLHGCPDAALLIDFRTLESRARAARARRLGIVVVLDSGERHAHASSGYNERRSECARACELLGVESLRDAGLRAGRAAAGAAGPPRGAHVIGENDRVRDDGRRSARRRSCRAAGPAAERLPRESARPLRGLHPGGRGHRRAAPARPGPAGARIVGGGFGGSVLAVRPRRAMAGARSR
jgi:hypothetical protein